MKLHSLFMQLADALDGEEHIECHASTALIETADRAEYDGPAIPLPESIVNVMGESDAHPVCKTIAKLPLQWTPPQTTSDARYVEHSACKAHVELLGPTGLVKSDQIRLGLYGMLPASEYGIRTHPAEEIYVMLAGNALWKRGELPYISHGVGDRSYHPSMMEHGTRTGQKASMSIYVWHGDVSTDKYVYAG